MTLVVRGQRVIPMDERLLSFVQKDDQTGCWNWTGAFVSAKRPYGKLVVGSRSDGSRRTTSAHRASYETWRGPIPDGLCVCHRCDNPRCINPGHFFLGTKRDNAADRDKKGRLVVPLNPTGESAVRAKLTAAEVREIRSSALSSRKIAETYGVSDSHIRAIRRGRYFPEPPA
jgi:hypothetical protein